MSSTPAPQLSGIAISPSSSTVSVSIIDSTTRISNVPGSFAYRPIYAGMETYSGPSFSFLVSHAPSNSRLLFDLGLRKDWETGTPPGFLSAIAPMQMKISVEKNVSEILVEAGMKLDEIDAIVYSHHHWDHTGDPRAFPAHTKIVVGPGYKATYLPGYPADPEAVETTAEVYAGREIVEVDFMDAQDSKTCRVGGFKGYDWFGDGSFYLLDTPGHTMGHLSALVRTTAPTENTVEGISEESTFIFLGGDIAHHAAVFRPTESYPLPATISPDPREPLASGIGSACPCEIFSSLHRSHSARDGERMEARTMPFCLLDGPDDDPAAAQRSVDELAVFDSMENVLTVFAHDASLLGVVDLFPSTANDWKSKAWGRQGHWRFLGDMKTVDKGAEKQ